MNSWLVISLLFLHVLTLKAQDTTRTNYPGTAQVWEKIFNGNDKVKEVIYYENDSVWMQAEYRDKIEYWNWYYENGKPYFQAQIVDDQLQGQYRIWYENGQIAEELSYSNHLEEGLAAFYYPNGILAASGTYSKGEMIGEWSFFNRKGDPANGAWKWLFAADSSQIRMKGNLRNGKMIGTWDYRALAFVGTKKEQKFTKTYENTSNNNR